MALQKANEKKLHYKMQKIAVREIRKAIEKGEIVRPKVCDLCGKVPTEQKIKCIDGRVLLKTGFMAHHYNGYENQLDVWWVCHSCNSKMRGEKFHNGSMSKDDVRKILEQQAA